MTSIRIIGCSHTQGIEHLERYGSNWVHYYRDKVDPSIPIYNYAQGGTSVVWHSFILSMLKNKYPNDIYITQLTTPGRYSWWDENINQDNLVDKCYSSVQLRENLVEYMIRPQEPPTVHWFNSGVVYSENPDEQQLSSSDLEFAKAYYDRDNPIHKWTMYVHYLESNSDYCFFHEDSKPIAYKNRVATNKEFDTSEQYIGKSFAEHFIDGGKHLSDYGNERVSDMVYQKTLEMLK